MTANGYGIYVYNNWTATTTNNTFITCGMPNEFTMKGVYFFNMVLFFSESGLGLGRSNYNLKENLLEDCLFEKNTDSTATVNNLSTIPEGGLKLNRCIGWRTSFFKDIAFVSSPPAYFVSGELKILDCISISPAGATRELSVSSTKTNMTGKMDVRNFVQHDKVLIGWSSGDESFYLYGANSYFDNIEIWSNYKYGALGAIYVDKLINPEKVNNIRTEGTAYGIIFTAQTQINVNITNFVAGLLLPHTYDIFMTGGGYADVHFQSPKLVNGLDTSSMGITVNGTKIRFSDYDEVSLDDRTYQTYGETQRCGTGLTDTTVHTSGTGKYSLRLKPTSSTYLAEWLQKIPTGNIQNKEMMVGCWVKINNAAYYGGAIHNLPTLTINYDNGTEATCVAAETTDWQFLSVPFTPLTTYGEVTMTVDGNTDATGSNSYFYIDDVSVLYPAGVSLNLAGLDLWANGLPVTPTIAQVTADAGSLWDALTANHTVAGSFGEKTTSLKNAWDELKENHTLSGSFGEEIGTKILTTGKFVALK